MKIRELMTDRVIRIHPEENVAVAARMLTGNNVGILPVCGNDGRICGLVTDRDLVTRCIAAGRAPAETKVAEIMTRRVVAVRPDAEASGAAAIMGKEQVRRLPVVENGKLCGMVSLADLAARAETGKQAVEALAEISSNLSSRD